MSEGEQAGDSGSAVEGVGEPGSVEAARALGEQLRRLRESVQLSQELMVRLHGGSKTSISRYENGDRIPLTSYVKALLEETDRRGQPLTDDALAAVWSMYERALGPLGGRNSERAALYAQEKQLRLVQAQEARATAELARLAAERDGLETETSADPVRRKKLDGNIARLQEHRAHLAQRRQQILTTLSAMPDPPGDGSTDVVPFTPPPEKDPGQPPPRVPPWKRLLTSLSVLLLAAAAIIWGVLLLQRDPADHGSDTSAGSTTLTSVPPPAPPSSRVPTTSAAPSPPPTTRSASPTTEPPSSEKSSQPPVSVPAAVGVRWHGNLVLDDGSSDGMPTTGWALDPVPPQRSAGGDISLACQLVCEPGRYVGRTIVVYNRGGTPRRTECVELLNANPGSSSADVPDGTTACFGTQAGRVGYFTPHAAGSGRIRLDATVWELPPD